VLVAAVLSVPVEVALIAGGRLLVLG